MKQRTLVGRIEYSKNFAKSLEKAPTKVKGAWRNRLALFIQEPSHPQLHNHRLAGQFARLRSINITGDWRALYSVQASSRDHSVVITFVALGTHSQLYR